MVMAKINGKYESLYAERLLKKIKEEDSITKRHNLINKYLCARYRQTENILANINDDENIDLTMVIEQLWDDLQIAQKQILQTMSRSDFYADYYGLDKWDDKFNG